MAQQQSEIRYLTPEYAAKRRNVKSTKKEEN